MKMKMKITGFPQGGAYCMVALDTQRQFGLGSPEPRQDSLVLWEEQIRESPAANKSCHPQKDFTPAQPQQQYTGHHHTVSEEHSFVFWQE